MDREVSSAISLGAHMIAIAAVLGLLGILFLLATSLQSSAFSRLADIDVAMTGALDVAVGQSPMLVPTSAAYSLILENERMLVQSECRVCGITAAVATGDLVGSCLLGHLTGKVNLVVVRESDSIYSVVLHTPECVWGKTLTAVCTCP